MSETSFVGGLIPAHKYEYFLVDLRNNAVVAEIGMTNVTYKRVLSGVGDFSGAIMINESTKNLFLNYYTVPGRYGVYVLRDGVPVWGGIIWKRTYSDSRELRVIAKTFESYFYKRLQHTTKYFDNEDQLDIARWLVENNEPASSHLFSFIRPDEDFVRDYLLQNSTAADLLINVSNATSTQYRSRTMFGYEFKTVGEELSALSNLIDGFDWNVEIVKEADGSLSRNLEFYYPYAGRPMSSSDLMFEYPGVVSSFTVTDDAENAANIVWSIGAGEGTEMVTAVAADDAQLNAGWPVIETSRSYKSVIRPSTLNGHADADLARMLAPSSLVEVTVRPDIEPLFGSYTLGDWARFRIEDIFLSPPVDYAARITEISNTVNDSTGLESIKLTLGGNEDREEDVTEQ